jgi:hypothetical protein
MYLRKKCTKHTYILVYNFSSQHSSLDILQILYEIVAEIHGRPHAQQLKTIELN